MGRPPALLALLCCCVWLAACDAAPVFHPYDSHVLYGRKVLVLQPSYVPPVSKALHTRIVDEVEKRLTEFPYLGKVMTRKEFLETARNNRKLMRTYRLLSDTASVVGFPDRETSRELGESQDVGMLMVVQLFYIPCPQCEGSSQLALVANLIDAKSGEVLWRADFSESVPDDEPEERAEEADAMVEELFEIMAEHLSPKWHRLRFKNLAQSS